LERLDRPPAATVLIDSYWPSALDHLEPDSSATSVGLGILDGLLAAPDARGIVDDVRLTAMAAYLGLLPEIVAEPFAAPALLLRATERIGEAAGEGEWRARWEAELDELDVPGNHLTVMEEHVGSTARAISDWLQRAIDEPEFKANEGRVMQR
jgi:polyketide synthase 7